MPSPTQDEMLRGQVQWQAQRIEGLEVTCQQFMGIISVMMGHMIGTGQSQIPAWNPNVGTLYPVSQVPFPEDPKQVRTFLGDESGRQLRAVDPGVVDKPLDIPRAESVTGESYHQRGSGVESGSGSGSRRYQAVEPGPMLNLVQELQKQMSASRVQKSRQSSRHSSKGKEPR